MSGGYLPTNACHLGCLPALPRRGVRPARVPITHSTYVCTCSFFQSGLLPSWLAGCTFVHCV
ncbi:hypothetical protein BKA80DRAFT_22705 [Phyllosticta citrichinensis]